VCTLHHARLIIAGHLLEVIEKNGFFEQANEAGQPQ
jgi:hypothetical protein